MADGVCCVLAVAVASALLSVAAPMTARAGLERHEAQQPGAAAEVHGAEAVEALARLLDVLRLAPADPALHQGRGHQVAGDVERGAGHVEQAVDPQDQGDAAGDPQEDDRKGGGGHGIVVDPGHGGHDFGSSGYLKKVYEKDIALQIAGRLAKKIQKKLPYEVLMTRNRDTYLTLEERTAVANTKNADLFISIHTNDSKNHSTSGIETYVLNLATDHSEITVAARENATSTKNISDLQTILSDLMQNAKINESSRLAVHVQRCMCKDLKKRYSRIKNKGVKQAPFYVLLGAQMPSILIETSFISNARECKRLVSPKYQERLAEGIVEGIRSYIKATSPTALMKKPQQSRPRG